MSSGDTGDTEPLTPQEWQMLLDDPLADELVKAIISAELDQITHEKP